MDINLLVKVTSRAWSLKILALIHEGYPARQAPLLSAAGASRTAFAQSLHYLEKIGVLERNPGHGHPLRPEYRLTKAGHEVAPIAHKIYAAVASETEDILLRKMWVVPVLAIARAPMTFSGFKHGLPPITDRALSGALQDLGAQHWIKRTVQVEMFPPRPYYQAINEGAEISRIVGL